MKSLNALVLLISAAALAACGGGTSTPTTATPTTTLSVDPVAVTSGGSATLTWSSSNTSACQATDGWTGTLATSGTQSTGALTGATTFSLTCTAGSASSTKQSVTVNIIPSVTLTATPATVANGGSAQLNWNSSNATACTASGGWTGALGASGSQAVGPLSATTIYMITCSGAGGDSPSASATVTVTGGGTPTPAPTVALAATPASIASGATSTLTWTTTNATGCTATGGWSGAKTASGGMATTPALTATTSYTLTCTGPGGTSPAANAVVTVTANPAPTVTLTASPASVTSGSSSTLSWSSTNATSCTASGSWSGTKATSGTAGTGSLTAAATYNLACSGSGGTANASATVSIVSGAMSPGTAALTIGQVKTFSNTLPGGTASYTVDGIAGGNAGIGTVTGAGVYTAGTVAGSHTLLATSTSNASLTQSATIIITDLAAIATYHQDNARDGANTQEYALTLSSVKTATFGKLASCTVDGTVAAQPLWLANVTIGGAAHNAVIVATQHDGLYAIDGDATPCNILWHVNLADTAHGAVAAGETSVPNTKVGNGYGDIAPEIGVTGTPVIDVANKILYVVSKSINAAQTTQYTRLHAIDLSTGAEKSAGSPTTIAATVTGSGTGGATVAFDTQQELQRPGLALANNTIYVSFGSHEDKGPWFGWIFGYQYAGGVFTQTQKLNTSPNHYGAGIWMSAGAPAVDDSNNLFVLTGNGPYDVNTGGSNYGDSLLKLSPALSVTDSWTPTDQDSDNDNDFDFGAGGAGVLAELPQGSAYLHVIVGGGKSGVLEVLNRDMLGAYTGPTIQEIQLGHGLFSTIAFWNNRLYVAAREGKLQHYAFTPSTAQFALTSQSTKSYGFPGATPAVSASGSSNGIVWVMDQNAYCTNQSNSCGPVVLHAYNAGDLTQELWNSGGVAADAAGYAVKFTTPTVANGHVYVGTRGNDNGAGTSSKLGTLEIYGLTP